MSEKEKLEELIIDMIVWTRQIDESEGLYKEFVDELRRNAKVRNINVEHLIEQAEKWERT